MLLALTAQILELVEIAPAIAPAAPSTFVPPARTRELILDQTFVQLLALVHSQVPPVAFVRQEHFQPLVALWLSSVQELLARLAPPEQARVSVALKPLVPELAHFERYHRPFSHCITAYVGIPCASNGWIEPQTDFRDPQTLEFGSNSVYFRG